MLNGTNSTLSCWRSRRSPPSCCRARRPRRRSSSRQSTTRSGATDCQGCEPSVALSGEPQVFRTQEQTFRVVPMTGLVRPWALTFLPNGDLLITEHGGRLRIVRDGVLDPEPLAGHPGRLHDRRRKGLMDIALHPRFAENQFVYFTYHQQSAEHRMAGTPVLARGKFEGRGRARGGARPVRGGRPVHGGQPRRRASRSGPTARCTWSSASRPATRWARPRARRTRPTTPARCCA